MGKLRDSLESQRQETHPPEMNFYRIEALRAASRVVAGLYDAKTQYNLISGGTLIVAEHFAKWLETGER